MPTLNLTTQLLNSKALKAYFKSILSLELIPLLSIISFFLSTLFISGVLGFRLLNFIYLINVLFLVPLVKSTAYRRENNLYPLLVSLLSILMSLIMCFWITYGLTELITDVTSGNSLNKSELRDIYDRWSSFGFFR